MRTRLPTAVLGLAAALPPLYRWTVRLMIRRNVEALRQGDIEPLLAGYAADAQLVFPGNSSWGGTYDGRQEIRGFVERFVAVGLKGQTHEILVNGPPWDTTIAVLFSDEATGPDRTVVYENRAILFGRISWGKITFQEDFEDTQKVAEFDEYLATQVPTAA